MERYNKVMNTKTYMQTYARKLDLRLFEYLFEGADAQPVLDELRAYQNADGGFGKALEPDLRLPDSSVLATTVALQYLAKVEAHADEPIDKAIRYLVKSYDNSRQRWVNIPSTADEYPRAPWWDYKGALKWAEWGNPSAEVLGYLLQYADKVNDASLVATMSERAIQRLYEINEPEQHEVKCYIRLYQRTDKDLQAKLYDRLAAQIKELAKTDRKDWEGYVATPLTFVDSPNSPFADLFDKQVLSENAQFIKDKIVDGSHWEPTWEWGQFKEEWAQAKKDWSGKLTVENLELLKAFDVKVDA
jgi:hypothetical protein